MLFNREDAEDATQEIMIRIVTRLSQFDSRSKVKTWAFRAAVNYILDVKKSAKERMRLSYTPATPIPPLIPTKGGEFGMRSAAVPHLQSTLSVWYLHSASELQQSGDSGGTVASQQPSERYGFELANYYTPVQNLAIDFDLANSKAQFIEIDGDDAAPDSPGGKRVPEAVGLVIASGVAVPDFKGLMASLRMRYFGPRDLTSDGIYRSQATALVNGELGYRFSETWRLSAEFLNLLNRRDHDIDYAYESKIALAAAPAFTNVFHPVEPFQVRFGIRGTF